MKNSYEILYGSKTRIEFKRGVISKISIKKKYICLQFCFIWVLREVSIDLFILLTKCTRLMHLTSIFKKKSSRGSIPPDPLEEVSPPLKNTTLPLPICRELIIEPSL